MSLKFNHKYLLATFLIIFLGITSRKISAIPFFVGDILYAIMMYCLIHTFIRSNHKTIQFLIPLVFCFIIELLQLIDVNWLNSIRKTTLGHYALGQGFLWSDLLCYTMGVSIAFSIDIAVKD